MYSTSIYYWYLCFFFLKKKVWFGCKYQYLCWVYHEFLNNNYSNCVIGIKNKNNIIYYRCLSASKRGCSMIGVRQRRPLISISPHRPSMITRTFNTFRMHIMQRPSEMQEMPDASRLTKKTH